ncbi:MAG: PQQ-binding-like beta-propeller repeat protein [Planctomycetes bacterium]|nr:PQQ-binding-like beta-propeller repeat protein [Planctomycetota bacterium]
MKLATVAHLGLFVVLNFAGGAQADNWPSWRGPEGNGISKETGLPVEWDEAKNVVWTLPLPGRGGATPVIWGDRIFLTSGEGNDQVLLCISTAGKELWKRKVGTGGRASIKGDEANEASASPSTDGKHVYAFVGTGNLACFDFDGKEIWNVNIQDRYGKFKIQHGLHSTPLLYEDRLYLSLLHSNGHWVIAIDKTNGKEVWKVERKSDAKGEAREAYTSPCLWHDGKETHLIVSGCDYATAHRLKDGKEMWRLGDLSPKDRSAFAFRIISSPVPSPDLLVVPTARGGLVVALKPGAQGAVNSGSEFELWRKAKGAPDVPTPLIHDGLVYLCRENGVLNCWDAKSGNQIYQEALERDRYRASPVYVDGRIYIASRNGTFSVIKAGPKFQLLATNRLNDSFTASPAVADGRIYWRGFNALYAIGNK